MSLMYVNVIHRADPGTTRLEALQFQQAEAHRHGLRTTILVTFGALFDPEVIAFVRAERDEYDDALRLRK